LCQVCHVEAPASGVNRSMGLSVAATACEDSKCC
jgi:hypothetical protein